MTPTQEKPPTDMPAESRRHVNLDGTAGGWVAPTATVSATAYIGHDALVYGHALVSGSAWVSGGAQVYGHARVFGDAWVSGNARVFGDAWVSGQRDILTVSPLGSEHRHVTAFRTTGGHLIVAGCWAGTADELEARVLADTSAYADLGRQDYLPFCALVRARFGGDA